MSDTQILIQCANGHVVVINARRVLLEKMKRMSGQNKCNPCLCAHLDRTPQDRKLPPLRAKGTRQRTKPQNEI
jgi:hypothetical protein